VRSDGFTLLEMLVAVALTALLVAAAVQAHLSIVRAQERAAAGLDRDRAAGVFLDRFERELSGSLLVVLPTGVEREQQDYHFVGTEAIATTGDADGVAFVTRSPARAAGARASTGVHQVRYTTGADRIAGLRLLRREEPLGAAATGAFVGEGDEVLDGVVSFGLRYQDEESGAWQDAWDSDDALAVDKLPTQVEVSLRLYEWDEQGEVHEGREHRRSVSLPVRPIDIETLRAEAQAGEEDGQCLTVRQCLGRSEQLGQLSAEEYADAVEGVDMDACWEPDGPAVEVLLELGEDPGGLCPE
jgi:type II secretion system protein J